MKNEKGLTLIELVVSVAVLSILIVPFFGIFTNAAKLDIKSKNDLTANFLAQQMVAEAKANPMGLISDSDWIKTTDDEKTVFSRNSLEGDFSKFSAKVTYEPLSTSISKSTFTILSGQELYDVVINLTFDCSDSDNDMTPIDFSVNGTTLRMYVVKDNSEHNIGGFVYHSDILLHFEDGKIELKPKNSKDKFGYTFSLTDDLNLTSDSSILINANVIGSKTNNLKKIWLSKDDIDNITINHNLNSKIKFNTKGQSGFSFQTLSDPASTIVETQTSLYNLEVEISGYDPIKKMKTPLKKVISTVKPM